MSTASAQRHRLSGQARILVCSLMQEAVCGAQGHSTHFEPSAGGLHSSSQSTACRTQRSWPWRPRCCQTGMHARNHGHTCWMHSHCSPPCPGSGPAGQQTGSLLVGSAPSSDCATALLQVFNRRHDHRCSVLLCARLGSCPEHDHTRKPGSQSQGLSWHTSMASLFGWKVTIS